jgi:hypothetical protein
MQRKFAQKRSFFRRLLGAVLRLLRWEQPGLAALAFGCVQVRNATFGAIYIQMHQFTKTGSGQT